MGLLDAIIEGIGNVILFIIGIFVLIFGVIIAGSSKDNTILSIIGFISIIVGLGLLVAKYKRQ